MFGSAGDIGCSDEFPNEYDFNLKDSGSLAFSEEVSTASRSEDVEGDVQGSNRSVVDIDKDSPTGNKSSRSSCNDFLGDVSSLAWGLCGDTYNKHGDSSFNEILFVSGSHGVTAHAFCQPKKIVAETKKMEQSMFWKGRWVEWGPYPTLPQNLEVQERSGSCETSGTVDENGTNENGEMLRSSYSESGNEELLLGNSAPKRYLQSFLAKIKTIENEDGIWTMYPEKTSVPCFTKVVSFNIFNYNLPPPNSVDDSSVNEQSWHEIILDTPSKISPTLSDTHFLPDILSNVFGTGMNKSYKCSRIFSSNSHCLIGFVLNTVDSVSADEGDETGNRNDTLVLVARVGKLGIRWASSVKFQKSLHTSPTMEWADFCFSNDFIVCLSNSGFIFVHSALSGKHVTCIDVLQACGLNPKYLHKKKDLQMKEVDQVQDDVSCRHDRRKFKRLLVDSLFSHFAVIDAFGVMYVVSAVEHMLEYCHGSESLLPHSHDFKLGSAPISWEIGGYDISCQRNYSESLQSILQDQKSQGGKLQSGTIRKIFLSTWKTKEDDCFCFSPMGLTQYIKRCGISGQNFSQVVHFDLHLKSEVHDDSCLKSQMIFVDGRKKDIVGEAVGCTSKGSLYLVTNNGLSVVLPSVTVSSNSLPSESVARLQPGILLGTTNPVKDLELKESKRPWSPWQVEVLDRVLLYESIDDADRLCSENGENNEQYILYLTQYFSSFNENALLHFFFHSDLPDEAVFIVLKYHHIDICITLIIANLTIFQKTIFPP